VSARVKVAESPGEVRDVMRIRHRVFVGEEGYLPDQGGMIVDFYDALPTTTNLVAVSGRRVVGSARITVDSEAGMPADLSFDFRGVAPDGARLASGSMLCVGRESRIVGRLVQGLMRMMFYRAWAMGCTHVCGPMNPKIRAFVERIGMVAVGEPFVDAKGLPTLPMIADLSALAPAFQSFVERQDFSAWMDTFEREFYEDGDVIVREGDPGDEAFLLVEGRAAALRPGQPLETAEVVQTFARGDVFGELALLTQRPRSATVRAIGEADAMVLRRRDFVRQLEANHDLAMALLRSMGDRFHDAVRGQRREEP